jgi:hypothetical protein
MTRPIEPTTALEARVSDLESRVLLLCGLLPPWEPETWTHGWIRWVMGCPDCGGLVRIHVMAVDLNQVPLPFWWGVSPCLCVEMSAYQSYSTPALAEKAYNHAKENRA